MRAVLPIAAALAGVAVLAAAADGAGSAGGGDDQFAAGALPKEAIGESALGILPPPPTVITLDTHYFGTITIDHAAHLARKAPCASCHGPGRITKPAFTAKIAHERCLGCHKREERGPQNCNGCHQRPPPPAEVAEAPAAAAAPAPKVPEPDPANVASAMEAFDRPSEIPPEPFTHRLEVGLAAGPGFGLAVRFATHGDYFVLSQSIDALRSTNEGRTFALVGAGVCRRINRDVLFEVSAVGGFDVFDQPVVGVFPAVGFRMGLDFRQPSPFLQNVTASLTGARDLSRQAFGRELGGNVIYGTLSTGFRIP